MVAPLKLREKVIEFLQTRAEQKFTARDIAQWLFDTYPAECRVKRTRSKATVITLDSDDAFIQQLIAEIGSSRPQIEKQNPHIKTTDDRPRLYYYSTKSDEEEVQETLVSSIASNESGTGYTEHDLYPKLNSYLQSEFGIHSKRIDEKRSRNSRGSGGNHWLFPDIVGFEDLSAEWDSEIKQCVKETSERKTRLWSFEVKKLINRSNVREAYFQAVSNSSWANFGYLVAAEWSGVDKELRMLAGLHGIGFIELNYDNPAESRIIIPAQERFNVDWNAANRLAEENTDFMHCVKSVRKFYQTSEVQKGDWDALED